MKPLCIHSSREELDQGLFGQAFYHLLQILPYLSERQIFPQWQLRSKHYADPPEYLTIPGVLDLAYAPPSGPYHRVSMTEFRRRHAHVLGSNWRALNKLWNMYFRIPERVMSAARGVLPVGKVLGIHYRGTDKQTTSWDSNPISSQEYLSLVLAFLKEHAGAFDAVFLATDEPSFIDAFRSAVPLPVSTLGGAEFHLSDHHTTTRAEKADRAVLDCVLLSQCACVIETSSALPSFAKLLQPDLEIYRCAASKLFGKLYTNMPYFPVAHIPVISLHDESSRSILARTMHLDWTTQVEGQPFLQPFTALPRWSRNHRIFSSAERLGVDKLTAYLVRGYS